MPSAPVFDQAQRPQPHRLLVTSIARLALTDQALAEVIFGGLKLARRQDGGYGNGPGLKGADAEFEFGHLGTLSPPGRSVTMPRFNPFNIEHGGRRWTAAWEIEGKDVVVSSAWGSGRLPIGRAKPEAVAVKVLRQIVEARATRH